MKLRLLGLMGSSLMVVALGGCGTPGAPSLPSLNLARPVEDLTASRRGNKVDLDWTQPRKNTDRTNVKHNPTTVICRHDGTTLMDKCEVVAEVTPPTEKAPQKQKGQSPPGDVRIHYVDTLPAQLGLKDPDGFVTYAVEEQNTHGRSAGLSNQVAIPVVPTIAAPDKVDAEVKAHGVHISWSGAEPPAPPHGVKYLYRIMRRPVGAPAYIVLDDVPPSASGTFVDKTFAWEQKYEYRITTLSQVSAEGMNAGVEGEDSVPVEVFTKDIYPPGQPVGLQAVFSSVGQKPFIDLTWAPNMESDLVGYNVYRWVENGRPAKLNAQPVQTASYRDETVEPGKKYFYAVTAVDQRGNESPQSTPASETAPASKGSIVQYCRFSQQDVIRYGVIEGQTITRTLNNTPRAFSDFEAGETTNLPLSAVRLLAPVEPTKIVCVGRNYREHAKELNHAIPTEPLIFFKPPSSIIGPDEKIQRPADLSERVDYEGELGVVIGKRCFRLREGDDVRPYILGYTCVNDVTARDLQNKDNQWARAKGFDTFCPVGPVVVDGLDPWNGVRVQTRVNGELKQDGVTSDFLFPLDLLLRYITSVMTLEAGDLIATGTPQGVSPVNAGDVVEVTVEGVGTLRNPLVDRK